MSRQIKFRAWDKTRELMIGDVGFIDGSVIIEPPYAYDNSNREVVEIEEAVLMQSTGLFDKNGKEIWEGDIVVAKTKLYGAEQNVSPARVDWNAGQSWYTLYGYYNCPLSSFYDLEVIGDIYQNQELLIK